MRLLVELAVIRIRARTNRLNALRREDAFDPWQENAVVEELALMEENRVERDLTYEEESIGIGVKVLEHTWMSARRHWKLLYLQTHHMIAALLHPPAQLAEQLDVATRATKPHRIARQQDRLEV